MAFASSSDKERTTNESTDNVTENMGAGKAKKKSKRGEKKVQQQAKLFKESTVELVVVRTLKMAMEIKPMPDQAVVLQVPMDVDLWEFEGIMEYANDVGYRIQNLRELLFLIRQRISERLKELSEVEDEADPSMQPLSDAEDTTSDDGSE